MAVTRKTFFRKGERVRAYGKEYVIDFINTCDCGLQIIGSKEHHKNMRNHICYCGKVNSIPEECDWGFNCTLSISPEDYLKTLDNL